MKKKYLVILLVLVFGFGIGICVDKLLLTNNDIDDGFNDLSQVKHEHMLSMMLETENGSGQYSLESRSTWPTKEDGYVFNSTLSKCEKGSKLRWDDENNAVVMVGTTSDKCYVYFDVYVEPPYHESCNDNTLACYVAKQYTGTQGANNLYYHDSKLENGANDNSYRYAGDSDSVNNFVCFGTDLAACPDDNLYRIIGVFGDQVKLIKWDYATTSLLGTDGGYVNTYSGGGYLGTTKGTNATTSIGGYYWNRTGTNTWSTSTLNITNLNDNFINNIGSTWENKIASTTWIVGGNTYANIETSAMNVAYQNEIVSPAESTTVNAKIGLMYVSDYGYAASSKYWTYLVSSSSGASYDYRAAIGENWMYMGLAEWTVVRRSGVTRNSFNVGHVGKVNDNSVDTSSFAVRPVFHFESSVNYVSGDGTKNSPIRIN